MENLTEEAERAADSGWARDLSNIIMVMTNK